MRNDVHSPSKIETENYEFIGVSYGKASEFGVWFLAEERNRIAEFIKRTGATYANHKHGGSCQVCGAHCIYTAVFHYVPDNKLVVTGMRCAEKLAGNESYAIEREIDGLRKTVAKTRSAMKKEAKGRKAIEERGLSKAIEIYESDETRRDIDIIKDITGRALKNGGNLSDKQWDFLLRLVNGVDSLTEELKKREEEKANALPVPEGRFTITGKVVSIKQKEGYYGVTNKVTVKSPDGWLVWGTLPSGCHDAKSGDTVQFDANVERSDDNKSFGFFKRPSQASVINQPTR